MELVQDNALLQDIFTSCQSTSAKSASFTHRMSYCPSQCLCLLYHSVNSGLIPITCAPINNLDPERWKVEARFEHTIIILEALTFIYHCFVLV